MLKDESNSPTGESLSLVFAKYFMRRPDSHEKSGPGIQIVAEEQFRQQIVVVQKFLLHYLSADL